MKKLILLGLMAGGLAVGQSENRQLEGPIRYNPATQVLSWTVNEGKLVKGKFKRSKKREYSIDFVAGAMTDGKVTYPLSEKEKAEVGGLFDALMMKYVVESSNWFESGGKYAEAPKRLEKAMLTR